MERYNFLVIGVLFFQVLSCSAMEKDQEGQEDFGLTWARTRGRFVVLKKSVPDQKETKAGCDDAALVKKKKKKTNQEVLKKPFQSLPSEDVCQEGEQKKLSPRSLRKIQESNNLIALAQVLAVKKVTPSSRIKKTLKKQPSLNVLVSSESLSENQQVVALPPLAKSAAQTPASSPSDDGHGQS